MAKGPVILAGMHRSGTSLAASLLHASGVNMGERLFPAGVGNVKGHFEDMDFVELQADILRAAGESWVGWTTRRDIPISAEHRARAKELLARKAAAGDGVWGWKDPRTTLFLDFWLELAPEASVVLMFRPPWEVIDSLYRRGSDEDMLSDPANAAVYCEHYTQETLAFYRKHREQCLLVANDAVTEDGRGFVAAVAKRFGLALKEPPADLFDASIMERKQDDRAALMAAVFPKSVELFLELNATADLPAKGYSPTWRAALPGVRDTALKDWLELRGMGRQLKQAASRERDAKIRAGNLEQELASVRKHAENLERLRGESAAHAANLELMLKESRQDAANLRAELERETGVRKTAEEATRGLMARVAALEAQLSHEVSRGHGHAGMLSDLVQRAEASPARRAARGIRSLASVVRPRVWDAASLRAIAGAAAMADGRWRVGAGGEIGWAGPFMPGHYVVEVAGEVPGKITVAFLAGTREVVAGEVGAGAGRVDLVLPEMAEVARLSFGSAGDFAPRICELRRG